MKDGDRRRGEPHVLDRQGHLDPRHDPRRLGDRPRRHLQGGSTITQQYIKILYLNSEQTLTRKFRELFLAYKINKEMSKEQILEGYLNTIYFGRGAYGIQAASKAYFDIDAKDLTVPQAAVLASVVNNPSLFDPADEDEHPAAARALSVRDHVDGRDRGHHARPGGGVRRQAAEVSRGQDQRALRRPQGLPAQDGRARAGRRGSTRADQRRRAARSPPPSTRRPRTRR